MKNSVSPSPPGTGSRAKSGWWPPTGRRPWTAPGGAGIFRTSEQITRDFTGRRTQTRTPRAEESVLGSYGPCSGIVSESWQRPGSGGGPSGSGPRPQGRGFQDARAPPAVRPAARCWLEPATPSHSHSGDSQVSPSGTEVAPPSSSGTLPRAGWGGVRGQRGGARPTPGHPSVSRLRH